jgi:hypothetical protein
MGAPERTSSSSIFDGYLTKKQLAQQIERTERTLDRMFLNGERPPRTKIGRTTLYRREAVLAWLRSQEKPSRPLQRGAARPDFY